MNDNFEENSLGAIEIHLWDLLLQSSKSANTPFHQGSFATINDNVPEQRTVILRNVDIVQKTLSFHTDIRSLKIQELSVNNSVSWLFYDKVSKIQLRLYAKAIIHKNDSVAEAAWERSRLSSKMCYTTQLKPGSFIESPELVAVNQTEVEPELLEFAHDNFAVIETQIYAVDFVLLNRNGNKRAYFDYESNLFQWKGV